MKNNRTLGWTTLEEAKLLVDAGLDPNTADMWISPKGKYVGDSKQTPTCNTYPCWSLGALIELMPKCVGNGDFDLDMYVNIDDEYCINYCEPNNIFVNVYATHEKNLIEAAVKCVIWSIKNGYIKKHK